MRQLLLGGQGSNVVKSRVAQEKALAEVDAWKHYLCRPVGARRPMFERPGSKASQPSSSANKKRCKKRKASRVASRPTVLFTLEEDVVVAPGDDSIANI
jgi:hypothetical protein